MKLGSYGTIKTDRQVLIEGKWVTSAAEGQTRFRSRARCRDMDGVTRQVEVYGASKGKAELLLKERMEERFKATTSTIGGDTLVVDVMEIWWDQLQDRGVSARTLQDYGYAKKRYITKHFSEVMVKECSVLLIEGVFRKIHRDNGPGATKTARAVLMQILQVAVKHGALFANPVRDAEVPAAEPVREPRALTREEEDKLALVLNTDRWTVHYDLNDPVRFMLATGIRLGELCAIRWVDVDLIAGTVDINGTAQRINGQGIVRKPSTKSKSGMRRIALPARVHEMLLRREELWTERFGKPGPELPVFNSPTGGVMDPANTQRLLRRLFKECEFTGVTSHTFRKTAATKLDEAGFSAREVADFLGHKQISMTLDTYMGRKTSTSRSAEVL